MTEPTPPSANAGADPANCTTGTCPGSIVDAYFAEKVVTPNPGTSTTALTVELRRIHRHILGRVLYVVVETINLVPNDTDPSSSSRPSVKISLKTVDDRLTGTAEQVIGITNLLRDGTADQQDFTAQIGNTDALKDIEGNCIYSNLADFANKAIFKIALRPNARATFDQWATRIAAAGEDLPKVGLVVRMAAEGATVNYNLGTREEDEHATPEFYKRPGGQHFELENKIVYEINHPLNLYNYWGTHSVRGATVRKRIAKIENASSTQAKYFFFNRIDNCYEIAEGPVTKVRRRANGRRIANTSARGNIPAGYVEDHPAPNGGDAARNYYYNQSARDRTQHADRTDYYDIVSVDTPGQGTDYGIRGYRLANPNDPNDKVELVRMPDSLNIDQAEGDNRVRAIFSFSGTARRFCNPGCFAGFIGVLIQVGRNDIVSTGMCFGDATSYPSVSHPNGDSVDTRYLGAQAAEQSKVTAFGDHYFTHILRGQNGFLSRLTGATYLAHHEDHLHAGEFQTSWVLVLND